jgi:hypothetical protein
MVSKPGFNFFAADPVSVDGGSVTEQTKREEKDASIDVERQRASPPPSSPQASQAPAWRGFTFNLHFREPQQCSCFTCILG